LTTFESQPTRNAFIAYAIHPPSILCATASRLTKVRSTIRRPLLVGWDFWREAAADGDE
jgi:hypothetical protein